MTEATVSQRAGGAYPLEHRADDPLGERRVELAAEHQPEVDGPHEQLQLKAPFCEACTSPAVPVARGGAIWLECASIQEERPFLKKLLSLDFGAEHTRRVILEDAA